MYDFLFCWIYLYLLSTFINLRTIYTADLLVCVFVDVECCTKLNKLLREGHRDICPWKHNFCPGNYDSIPVVLKDIYEYNVKFLVSVFYNNFLYSFTIKD